jgi:type IV pilus assembly protein PilW
MDKTSTMKAKHNFPGQAAGFSLVELMVGVIIAIIGSIVIFQVFAVSEGYKRTSVAGSDAQQGGVIALYSIERDLRIAGFGVNDTTFLGCNVLAYNDTRAPTNFNFALQPILITQGAGNNATTGVGAASDTITVLYGNSTNGLASVQQVQNMASTTEDYKVSNRYGFRVNDLIVAAEGGLNCTLAQASALPTGGLADTITHADSVAFNPTGGLGVVYTSNALLYNLGPAPTLNVYSIINNTLNVQSLLTLANANIADNIINLQAVYCKDLVNTPPTTFTTCDAIAPATWDQAAVVRVGLLSQSARPERDCNVTASSNIPWSGGTFDVSTVPNWSCHRFTVFQTTIPLRNLIWTF